MKTKDLVAGEPVSRILYGEIAAAIIPLGRGSRHDSSGLPEG